MPNARWVEVHKSQAEKSDEETKNFSDAIDTEAEVRRQILNTQSSIDTIDELKAQKRNLGPKDTAIENDEPTSPRP